MFVDLRIIQIMATNAELDKILYVMVFLDCWRPQHGRWERTGGRPRFGSRNTTIIFRAVLSCHPIFILISTCLVFLQ